MPALRRFLLHLGKVATGGIPCRLVREKDKELEAKARNLDRFTKHP